MMNEKTEVINQVLVSGSGRPTVDELAKVIHEFFHQGVPGDVDVNMFQGNGRWAVSAKWDPRDGDLEEGSAGEEEGGQGGEDEDPEPGHPGAAFGLPPGTITGATVGERLAQAVSIDPPAFQIHLEESAEEIARNIQRSFQRRLRDAPQA